MNSSEVKVWGDRWKAIRRLPAGGQGDTYLVSQDSDEGTYVLKELRNRRSSTARGRFMSEIEALSRIDHEHVSRIVDSGESDGELYYIAEYYSGGDLAAKDLTDYSLLDKLAIFEGICEGIAVAHSNDPRIIHRDLKPKNVYLREDGISPVVGDFGICLIGEPESRLTQEVGEMVGARYFIAPECEDGIADITPSADVYSLGKLFYWLISNGVVFSRARFSEPRFDLRVLHPDSERMLWIYELFEKTIQENPRDRIQTGEDLLKEVEMLRENLSKNKRYLDFSRRTLCEFCRSGYFSAKYKTRRADGGPLASRINPDAYRARRQEFQGVEAVIFECEFCGSCLHFSPRQVKDNWRNAPSEL